MVCGFAKISCEQVSHVMELLASGYSCKVSVFQAAYRYYKNTVRSPIAVLCSRNYNF